MAKLDLVHDSMRNISMFSRSDDPSKLIRYDPSSLLVNIYLKYKNSDASHSMLPNARNLVFNAWSRSTGSYTFVETQGNFALSRYRSKFLHRLCNKISFLSLLRELFFKFQVKYIIMTCFIALNILKFLLLRFM